MYKIKGRPFDKHRCFFIKDFKQGDSIKVFSENGSLEKGIVTGVDFDNLEIKYKTSKVEKNKAFVSDISFLGRREKDWLEE